MLVVLIERCRMKINYLKWANVYTANNGYDAAKNKVSIMKSLPVTLNSSVGTYTVPVTSQNKLRFKLETWRASDKTHTFEETWYDLSVVKSDVALSKITLVDANTKATLDPNKLEAGQSVLVRYTYKNNTDVKVYVEGFKNDKTQITVDENGEKVYTLIEAKLIIGGVFDGFIQRYIQKYLFSGALLELYN